MNITVVESVTRECCAERDLRPMEHGPFAFCVHCGRHWKNVSPPGTLEYVRSPVWTPLLQPWQPSPVRPVKEG
jgi:hypothetical protein